MDDLLRGILIGLLFGLPVGAVGTMTVQHTLSSGIKAGLLRGIMLVCGVFIGTYIWWGTLTAVTNIIPCETAEWPKWDTRRV